MIPAHHPFQFKTADGLTLQGVTYGSGYPEIVFTHGNGLPVQCYAPALEPLSSLARVYALNARGHGGSDVPREFPGWDEPLADLRDFITQQLHAPVILLAHSFGANLSLRLTAEHPELVRGLVMLDPIIPFRRGETWPEGAHSEVLHAKALARRNKWPSRGAAESELKDRGGYKGWRDEPFRQFLEAGFLFNEFAEFVLACPPWLEAAIFKSRPASITWLWAERSDVPAVVVHGENSAVSSAQAHQDLANALPQGRLVTVAGGHNFAQEHPEATGRVLAEILKPMLAPG